MPRKKRIRYNDLKHRTTHVQDYEKELIYEYKKQELSYSEMKHKGIQLSEKSIGKVLKDAPEDIRAEIYNIKLEKKVANIPDTSHDKDIFDKADSILNEQFIQEIYQKLRSSRSIHHNDITRISRFLDFFSLPHNKYNDLEIADKLNKLTNSLYVLKMFIDTRFKKNDLGNVPNPQYTLVAKNASELKYNKTAQEYTKEYGEDELDILTGVGDILEIQKFTDDINSAYNNYRQYIAEKLKI